MSKIMLVSFIAMTMKLTAGDSEKMMSLKLNFEKSSYINYEWLPVQSVVKVAQAPRKVLFPASRTPTALYLVPGLKGSANVDIGISFFRIIVLLLTMNGCVTLSSS